MSEEIKTILEEMRFKAGIYRDHKKRDLSFNDEEKNCALLLDYIQQKENIIKEVREYIRSKSIKFTMAYVEDDGRIDLSRSDYRIDKLTSKQVKELLEILDKEM